MTSTAIKKFQTALIDWFEANAKSYPWRETADPWAILVSEIMLQQTQVATVLNKGFFTHFLEKFPTPQALAVAPEQEILSAWEGLGYYRRVRNLQKAAIAIVEEHDGVFPRDHAEILALPGIGKYTAGAVSSFAYNDAQPIVDANVARIFSRIFDYQERVDSTAGTKQLWLWADELLHHKNVRSYNAALMELGQQTCTNKNPICALCIVNTWCETFKKKKDPQLLPLKKSAKKTVLVEEHALFVIHPQKGLLLQQESQSQRRAGMWKLPLRTELETEKLPLLNTSTYAITHHKVTLKVYQTHSNKLNAKQPNETYHPLDQLENLPVPSPFRKVINALLAEYI